MSVATSTCSVVKVDGNRCKGRPVADGVCPAHVSRPGPEGSWTDTDLVDRMVSYLASGATVEVVAGACGIPLATFNSWRNMAATGQAPPELQRVFERFYMAECRAQLNLLAKVVTGDAGGTGAKWVLARRFPDVWGDRIDVTSQGQRLGMSEDTLVAAAETLARLTERRASRQECDRSPQYS